MKARVKATGKIVEVAYHGLGVYIDMNQWDKEYQFDEIVVLDNGDPDYWTRLEHTYAGMAMQGLMSYVKQITPKDGRSFCDEIVGISVKVAHALVEKYKKEEK